MAHKDAGLRQQIDVLRAQLVAVEEQCDSWRGRAERAEQALYDVAVIAQQVIAQQPDAANRILATFEHRGYGLLYADALFGVPFGLAGRSVTPIQGFVLWGA